MDPVSLALGIGGILPLVTAAIKLAREYRSAIRNRSESIDSLLVELESLETCIHSLTCFLNGDELRKGEFKFGNASVLRSCSTACEMKLKILCEKLGQQGHGRVARYLWPLSEKEHAKTVQELRNFTTWMQLALSVDGCRLLASTKETVLKILNQQLEHFSTMQSVHIEAIKLNDTLKVHNRLLEQTNQEESRRSLLDWISTVKHDQKHAAVRKNRVANTGSWLLQRTEYLRWRSDMSTSNILWCPGIQGSGKTTIVSAVIEDIVDHSQISGSLTAYFYFDYQEHESQTPSAVLNGVLRQLVENSPIIPAGVTDLHERSKVPKNSLPKHECERLILETVSQCSCSYLIFDALDESDSQNRRELLQILVRLGQQPKLRIFMTSRPHIQDVSNVLGGYPQVTIEAKDIDIRAYLNHELHRNGIHQVVGHEFAERLLSTLPKQAEGMFLLPVFQLRTILKEPTLGEMEDALKNLSHDLIETFDQTIQRVQNLPESRSRLAMNALMWISHANRPLTVPELVDVLAIRRDQKKFQARYRPSPNMILECCQGLVILDHETNVIRPAHYTIQEYLIGHSTSLFPRAASDMAFACIQCLTFDDFASGPWNEDEEIDSYLSNYPFLRYAAQAWGRHASSAESNPEVWSSLQTLFKRPPACAVANQVLQYCKDYRRDYYQPSECWGITPLHHSARSGLILSLNWLLDSGLYDVNVVSEMGTTPVISAAADNHVSVVKTLLQRGANPFLTNFYGNALHCAIEAGSLDTMRELIDWGMRSHLTPGYWTCALDHDRGDALELLIDLGTVTNRFIELRTLFFLEAALSGSSNILEVMLRRKWADMDAREKGSRRTAVHLAAMAPDPRALSLLIEYGAELDAADCEDQTPLELAKRLKYAANVKLLETASSIKGNKSKTDKGLSQTEAQIIFDST